MPDFLNLLIDTAWLQAQLDAHPRDMWAFTFFVLALGFAFGSGLTLLSGWAKTRHDAMIRALELDHERLMERERAERETAEKEERTEAEERERVKRFATLAPQLKSILRECFDEGSVTVGHSSRQRNGFASTLCDMKVLCVIDVGERDATYMVMPDIASFVSSHYGEIFE